MGQLMKSRLSGVGGTLAEAPDAGKGAISSAQMPPSTSRLCSVPHGIAATGMVSGTVVDEPDSATRTEPRLLNPKP